MKYTNLILLIFLSGCASNADWGKYRASTTNTTTTSINNEVISMDELNSALDQIQKEAQYMDMSVVEYLHQVNTNKVRRVTAHDLLPDPFLTNEISALLEKMNESDPNYTKDFVLYQAWDYQHPNVSPAFTTKEEAQEYADGNNTSNGRPTGHKYVVREINHRYEVRHQNDAVNDVIFTSYDLNESENYLNTYKANHTDLVIFDLMKQEIVGVNTP